MTNISQAIVFFGTEEFSLTALEGLINSGYNIAAVVTKPDSKRGRGQVITPPSVKKLADRHKIPVWQPSKLTDILDDINKLSKPAGVLVSYGKIIPSSIIDLFEPGIINVHPSLLPKYRGPSPIETVIANGDLKTGVSIMKLSAQMDAGPVYGQLTHSLDGNETQPELYNTLAKAGTAMLLSLLPSILDGTLKPKDQDDKEASYSHLLKKDTSRLDPNKLTAAQAERLVRAHLDFPRSTISLDNRQVIVTKAHVDGLEKPTLGIQFQDGNYLSIDELIIPGGRKISASDYISGYRDKAN